MPRRTWTCAWAEELADGLAAEAALAGASVVGGDISASPTLTIAVTALGDLRGADPVLRSGAKPGDIVAVAGRLGLRRRRAHRADPRLPVSPKVLVEAYRRPIVPYASGPAAARMGATSMIDVSDGLLADLGHVATASGVGIDLETALIEVPSALRDVSAALGVDPYTWILAGGDDHALVATFPRGRRADRRVAGDRAGAGRRRRDRRRQGVRGSAARLGSLPAIA